MKQINPVSLRSLLFLNIIEGMVALFFTISVPSEAGSARLFGLSYARLGLAMLFLMAIIGLTGLLFALRGVRGKALVDGMHGFILYRLFIVNDGLLWGVGLMLGSFLFTYLSFPPPLRPLFAWMGLVLLQVWAMLRWAYSDALNQRKSVWAEFRQGWVSLTATQKRVFWILFLVGWVYWAAFAPVNWLGAESPDIFNKRGGDEWVTYQILDAVLTPGETLDATLYHVIVYEDYHYGYPFYVLSALAVLPVKLVFGAKFAAQTQINLFLLRQLVSVFPIIAAAFVLTWSVTRFRSWWSLAMYLSILLIPGVIKQNVRFWHPDAWLVLLVALTLFFLQRDNLRLGRDFYRAAIMTGLAAGLKLYGFFFFLAVGGYLVAVFWTRRLVWSKIVLDGLGFVLVMGATIIISNPFLLVPSARERMVEIMTEKTAETRFGYNEPDPEGVYQTGLGPWMRAFQSLYTEPYFFWFLVSGLVATSLWGEERLISRLILAWCVVLGGYVVFLVAVKSYHYLLPLMLPLYGTAFLLPSVTTNKKYRQWLTAISFILVSSQTVFNLVNIATSTTLWR